MKRKMQPVVALVDMREYEERSLEHAVSLIGGIDDLNTPERTAAVKVGAYSANGPQHTSVSVLGQIIQALNRTHKVYIVESDSYQGKGSDKLQIWKQLYSERVVPFNLSDDTDTRTVNVNNPIREVSVSLSHILFKPNVFVCTHILRSCEKGSILKNLFGLPPTPKKGQYHKNEIFCNLLADMYCAIGGIDLAVLDGTYLHHKTTDMTEPVGLLIVGRNAVAVETVGATLAGLKPEKMVTIQEFERRGLGSSRINDIEIVGASFEDMLERCQLANRKLKAAANAKASQQIPERTAIGDERLDPR